MPTGADHASRVGAWVRASSALPPEQVLLGFERVFGAMWRRARLSLGEVTLSAILNRVIHDTAARAPLLGRLRADVDGLHWEEVHADAHASSTAELLGSIELVMVEYLRILGNLTAEVLTPALHAELSRESPDQAVQGGSRASSPPPAASDLGGRP